MMLPVLLITSLVPKEPDQKKILAEGQETSAEVTRIETDNSTEINGTHPQRIYFRYKVDGVERRGKMNTMSVDEVSDWKPGRQISIKYLGDEATIPELSPVNFPIWLFDLIFGLMSFFFMLIGLVPLLYGLLAAWKKTQILRWGVVTPVRVLSISERGAAFGPLLSLFGVNRYEVSYSTVDEQAKPLIGRATTGDLLFVGQCRVGDEAEILAFPGQKAHGLVLDAGTVARLNAV